MKLAIRIQHKAGHREWWVKQMINLLGNDKRIQVSTDYEGNLWNNCRKTLTSYGADDTHLLVLQDDILPCMNFIPTVEKAIELLPDQFITFFTTSQACEVACIEKKSWYQLTTWFMAQAYVMPTNLIGPMLAWMDEYIKPDTKEDDFRFAIYCFYNGRKVWGTAPSLVEHIAWAQTTLGYELAGGYLSNRDTRMARSFIGIDRDPLTIDWTAGLDRPVLDRDGQNSMFCDRLSKPLPTI